MWHDAFTCIVLIGCGLGLLVPNLILLHKKFVLFGNRARFFHLHCGMIKHDMTQHSILMDEESVSTPSAFGHYSVGAASFIKLDPCIFARVIGSP